MFSHSSRGIVADVGDCEEEGGRLASERGPADGPHENYRKTAAGAKTESCKINRRVRKIQGVRKGVMLDLGEHRRGRTLKGPLNI